MRHAALTCTGRAGLTVLFRALRRLAPADRNEVIVPAYMCYSVAASASRAGLRVRPVDVNLGTLDFDTASLTSEDFRRVLAVVATNLYGLPSEVRRLSELAGAHGAFVIDDAAQAMGAAHEERWCGTRGDAGLFSFDKGKALSAIDGGIILTNRDDVADALARELARLPSPSWRDVPAYLAKVAVYATFLRPGLYGIPNAIPALKLGTTSYRTDFSVTGYSALLASLGTTMLRRLDEFVRIRARNADAIRRAVHAIDGVAIPVVAAESRPSYLRFPVLLPSRAVRDGAVEALRQAGIGATGSYPAAIADIPELNGLLAGRRDPGAARQVADRILTLPTHPYVTPPDVDRMADVIATLLRSRPEAALASMR